MVAGSHSRFPGLAHGYPGPRSIAAVCLHGLCHCFKSMADCAGSPGTQLRLGLLYRNPDFGGNVNSPSRTLVCGPTMNPVLSILPSDNKSISPFVSWRLCAFALNGSPLVDAKPDGVSQPVGQLFARHRPGPVQTQRRKGAKLQRRNRGKNSRLVGSKLANKHPLCGGNELATEAEMTTLTQLLPSADAPAQLRCSGPAVVNGRSTIRLVTRKLLGSTR